MVVEGHASGYDERRLQCWFEGECEKMET